MDPHPTQAIPSRVESRSSLASSSGHPSPAFGEQRHRNKVLGSLTSAAAFMAVTACLYQADDAGGCVPDVPNCT